MKLRPYQEEAVDAVAREFASGKRSTLVVLPTGCGKTVVFSHVIDRMRSTGRTMVLAHRQELIHQAADKIGQVTGTAPDIEMGDSWADVARLGKESHNPVVVASKDTLYKQRLKRFDPAKFGLIVTDEAHHAVAQSYRRVYDYFPTAKHLGVTATPDRTDEEALGKVYESVAYVYEILDAINDGYLVPIEQRYVYVEGLDFSKIRTTAGDLNGKDLEEVLTYEENIHKVVSPLVELTGTRRTLVFAVTVKHADRLAEVLNRHKERSARVVSGTTPAEERIDVLRDFRAGKFQYLVNVGVFTEGFDEPGIQVIALARPTKSRSLYAQMVGRGTRPLPGLIDGPDMTNEDRRLAIETSPKPRVEVIDFEGNSGKHKLSSVADILGGNYDEKVVEAAVKKAKESGGSVDMAEELAKLEEERKRIEAELRAKRARLVAQADFKTQIVNPFDVFDIRKPHIRHFDRIQEVTPAQRAYLERRNIDVSRLCKKEASVIIGDMQRRKDTLPPSPKQWSVLKRAGYDPANFTAKTASETIDTLAKNGWKKPEEVLNAAS